MFTCTSVQLVSGFFFNNTAHCTLPATLHLPCRLLSHQFHLTDFYVRSTISGSSWFWLLLSTSLILLFTALCVVYYAFLLLLFEGKFKPYLSFKTRPLVKCLIVLKQQTERLYYHFKYHILPCIMCTHVFDPNFQEENLSF